jgi:uncharacterized protein (TIGR03083 family)
MQGLYRSAAAGLGQVRNNDEVTTFELPTERVWLTDTTALMLRTVGLLADDAFATQTPLPEWTIGHVVAHLHFNAVAIQRLVTWARTGVETPMYASTTQRNADIALGATLPPSEMKRLVVSSSAELDDAFDSLAPEMWTNLVVTAQGRTVPATELVWMRVREVMVHTIDLDPEVLFSDMPADAVTKLVNEITARRLSLHEGPSLAAVLTGRTAAGAPLGPWL